MLEVEAKGGMVNVIIDNTDYLLCVRVEKSKNEWKMRTETYSILAAILYPNTP